MSLGIWLASSLNNVEESYRRIQGANLDLDCFAAMISLCTSYHSTTNHPPYDQMMKINGKTPNPYSNAIKKFSPLSCFPFFWSN